MTPTKLCIVVASFLAAPAFAACPIVTRPESGDRIAAAALEVYLAETLVQGARGALLAHDFCPVEEGIEVQLKGRDCTEAVAEGQCVATYSISDYFEHVNSEQRWIDATVTLEVNADGTGAEGMVSFDHIELAGIAERRELDLSQSEAMMAGMELAGVAADPMAIDATVRKASSLMCQSDITSTAPGECLFRVGSTDLFVNDPTTSHLVMNVLADLHAYVIVADIVHAGGVMVECLRRVASPAPQCTIFTAPIPQ